MSFADDLATSQHAGFRGRVLMATVKTAVAVANEAPAAADDSVASRRHALAYTVLNSPATVEDRFVWAVLTNATVASAGINATDSDLEYVLTTVWNAVAGTQLTGFTG